MSDCLFYENLCRVRNACKSLPDSGIHALKQFSVWLWRHTPGTGAQFEGDLGEILALGAEILPYIGLREKWEFP